MTTFATSKRFSLFIKMQRVAGKLLAQTDQSVSRLLNCNLHRTLFVGQNAKIKPAAFTSGQLSDSVRIRHFSLSRFGGLQDQNDKQFPSTSNIFSFNEENEKGRIFIYILKFDNNFQIGIVYWHILKCCKVNVR